jgi:hypothetical protein
MQNVAIEIKGNNVVLTFDATKDLGRSSSGKDDDGGHDERLEKDRRRQPRDQHRAQRFHEVVTLGRIRCPAIRPFIQRSYGRRTHHESQDSSEREGQPHGQAGRRGTALHERPAGRAEADRVRHLGAQERIRPNSERRSFALLRPVADAAGQDRVRDAVLAAYAEYEETAAAAV